MRLVTRMAATFAVAGITLFGSYGAWLVRQERLDLHAAVEREVLFLGTSLRVGVENALRDRQLSDIEEASLRLEGIDTDLDVYVFDVGGAPVVAATGVPSAPLAERVRGLIDEAGRLGQSRLDYFPDDRTGALLLAAPLASDGGDVQGTLVIVRPLDDVTQDLADTTWSIVVIVALFVASSVALAAAIGHARLTRPIGQLMGAMRAVRDGREAGPLGLAGDDELVALAAEFDDMYHELRAAQGRAAAESEARREAMRSLQAADRWVTVGQLSAAVAHEIGSPLQVLLGRARALAERPDDAEQTRRVAGILVREGERITRIVGQLLSWSRRRPAQRGPVDVAAAAREVAALLEIEARRRGVHLVVTEETRRPAWADVDQLQQVLLNLLTNALAATHRGGTVEVSVRDGEGGVQIEVRDDGAGMDDETRERVFEPLFTTRGERGGAGLGLVVVRGIVTEHGGRIAFTTALGAGTTFSVAWPAAEAE